MPAEKNVKTQRVVALRDLAVVAAMRHGCIEVSGEARLVVLREAGLMIAYRTPFNPLPRLTESMRFEAALRGKSAYREPYGIEIWQERLGKVLSVGWRNLDQPVVDNFEHGLWEQGLADIARHDSNTGLCRKCAVALASRRQPLRGERNGHSRGRKRA
jgi:hypothetical protein